MAYAVEALALRMRQCVRAAWAVLAWPTLAHGLRGVVLAVLAVAMRAQGLRVGSVGMAYASVGLAWRAFLRDSWGFWGCRSCRPFFSEFQSRYPILLSF